MSLDFNIAHGDVLSQTDICYVSGTPLGVRYAFQLARRDRHKRAPVLPLNYTAAAIAGRAKAARA